MLGYPKLKAPFRCSTVFVYRFRASMLVCLSAFAQSMDTPIKKGQEVLNMLYSLAFEPVCLK